MAITLIKETGSGLETANVYADLTDFEGYCELTGEDVSGYTDEQKKSALYIAANKFIDRLHSFLGERINESQAMKLYTDLVTFEDASKDIILANIEAAILHLKGYLFVDASEQNAKGDVIAESSELDVLKESFTYSEGSSVTTKYNTAVIDMLLKPYLTYGSGGVVLRVV